MSHDLNLTRSTIRHDNPLRRTELKLDERMSKILREKSLFPKGRPAFSSTPLPDRMFGRGKTMCDKATQTDPRPPSQLEKLQQVNFVLRKLYSQFAAFVSEKEETQSRAIVEGSSNRHEISDYVEPQAQDIEDDRRPNGIKIRRVSAQTTNNVMPADNSDLVCLSFII